MPWVLAIVLSYLWVTVAGQGSLGGDQSSCTGLQKWKYRGCFADTDNGPHVSFTFKVSSDSRSVRYYPAFTGKLTPGICQKACRGHGFRFAALYNGTDCYCSSAFPDPTARKAAQLGPDTLGGNRPGVSVDSSQCRQSNIFCSGDRNQFCGSDNAADVYEDSSFSSDLTVASFANYAYAGCFAESPPHPLFVQIATNTTQSCATYCGLLGYPLAGRAGFNSQTQELTCGCGTEIQTGNQVGDSFCNFRCDGSLDAIGGPESCGGQQIGTLKTFWTIFLNKGLRGCYSPPFPGATAVSSYSTPSPTRIRSDEPATAQKTVDTFITTSSAIGRPSQEGTVTTTFVPTITTITGTNTYQTSTTGPDGIGTPVTKTTTYVTVVPYGVASTAVTTTTVLTTITIPGPTVVSTITTTNGGFLSTGTGTYLETSYGSGGPVILTRTTSFTSTFFGILVSTVSSVSTYVVTTTAGGSLTTSTATVTQTFLSTATVTDGFSTTSTGTTVTTLTDSNGSPTSTSSGLVTVRIPFYSYISYVTTETRPGTVSTLSYTITYTVTSVAPGGLFSTGTRTITSTGIGANGSPTTNVQTTTFTSSLYSTIAVVSPTTITAALTYTLTAYNVSISTVATTVSGTPTTVFVTNTVTNLQTTTALVTTTVSVPPNSISTYTTTTTVSAFTVTTTQSSPLVATTAATAFSSGASQASNSTFFVATGSSTVYPYTTVYTTSPTNCFFIRQQPSTTYATTDASGSITTVRTYFVSTSTTCLTKVSTINTTVTGPPTSTYTGYPTGALAIATMPAPYTYYGCWKIVGGNIIVGSNDNDRYEPWSNLTAENCAAYCALYQYQYMALWDRETCFCDDYADFSQSTQLPASNCQNGTCSGNSSEACGSTSLYPIMIYNATEPLAFNYTGSPGVGRPPSTSYTNVTTSTKVTYTYLGCINGTFSHNNRTAALNAYTNRTNEGSTVEMCSQQCGRLNGAANSSGVYPYMGLGFGGYCFCDYMVYRRGYFIDPVNCNQQCAGNSSETCGGNNAISLYSAAVISNSASASVGSSGSLSGGIPAIARKP